MVTGSSVEVVAGEDEVAGTGSTITTELELETLVLALTLAEADAVALGSNTAGSECDGGDEDDGASQYSPTQCAYRSLLPASQEPSMQAAT